MTDGQWRVFGLLLLLLLMESLRHPGIRAFFKAALTNPFQQASSG